MAQTIIPNGTPYTYSYGVNDKSKKTPIPGRAFRGIHEPMVLTFAEWGPVNLGQRVNGGSLALIFGDKTFDERGPFATHVTPFLNTFLKNANTMTIRRVVPADIGPKASLRLSVEVVKDEKLKKYKRTEDGSFERDNSNQFKQDGSEVVSGYKVRYVISEVPQPTGSAPSLDMTNTFGKGEVKNSAGTITNTDGDTTADVYPLFDFEVPHYGAKGNKFGIRLWAPTRKDPQSINDNIFTKDNTYPYRVAFTYRENENASPRLLNNINGEKSDEFTLNELLIDTAFGRDRSPEAIMVEGYQDLHPKAGLPPVFGPLGKIYVYQENIDNLLTKFFDAEKALPEYTGGDFYANGSAKDTEENKYIFNILGLQNSSGVPYQAVRRDETNPGVRFNDVSTFNFIGGTDGSLNKDAMAKALDAACIDMMNGYGDPDHEYQDWLTYPASYFWDSGFGVEAKNSMGKFISQRKNTAVVIATAVAGEKPLDGANETARAIGLFEKARAYAESDYYATPAFRFAIVPTVGKGVGISYKKPIPATIELANMASRMAAGLQFDSAYLFDREPYNRFEILTDVTNLWKPYRSRVRDWNIGILYPEKVTENEVYFPATRTGYTDDTSVLNSFINMMILAETETVGLLQQKRYSGGNFTQAQLKARVEDSTIKDLANRFAGLAKFEVLVYFTEADNARGYSWTLKIKVYLANMKTVQTLKIEAYDVDHSDSKNAFTS